MPGTTQRWCLCGTLWRKRPPSGRPWRERWVALPDHRHTKLTLLYPQLDTFMNQNSQLLKELTSLNSQFNDLQEESSDMEARLDALLGRPAAVEALSTVEECEELERTLKASLEAVEERKVRLLMLICNQFR